MKKPGNKAFKIMVLIFLFFLLMITAGCTHKEEAEVIRRFRIKPRAIQRIITLQRNRGRR
jgi:hypothetical protein